MSSFVCDIVAATYDMGLQIDVITKEGATTLFGTIGQWPCFEFDVTDDLLNLQRRIKNKESLTRKQLLNNNIIKELCTYHDLYNGYWELSGKQLTKALNQIKKEMLHIDLANKKIYAYASLVEDDLCIKLLPSVDELKSVFLENAVTDCRPFDDMEDAEIEEWYGIAEENEWDNFPLFPFDDYSENEPETNE